MGKNIIKYRLSSGKLNAHDMPTLSRRSVTGLPKYVRSAWPEIPQNIKMFSSKSAPVESSLSITGEFQRELKHSGNNSARPPSSPRWRRSRARVANLYPGIGRKWPWTCSIFARFIKFRVSVCQAPEIRCVWLQSLENAPSTVTLSETPNYRSCNRWITIELLTGYDVTPWLSWLALSPRIMRDLACHGGSARREVERHDITPPCVFFLT